MNECRQPVREVEVGCVPPMAIQLQRDESQCICAEGERRGGGGGCIAHFLSALLVVCVCVCVCV